MSVLKTHIALNVTNIEKSVTFYQAMFGVEPVKYKTDYAKFDISKPPLNLTLNITSSVQSGGALSHLGVQVESTQEVQASIQRFAEAGLALFTEENTECCYALQDKVWVTDPDGNRWEVFVVKVADTKPAENVDATIDSEQVVQPLKKSCCA
ncbi:VOC family protein [Anabaena cylindrica FACHB-243]|uniref:Glyoxalase/bleomycin resistance protein/dioxygenase n=1 Tax=Anabaena cylindrica (strain ATCC 27899 / PCC 7122) TaxID=272123 RepID=K9ZMF4_ANACC|nr:MULTISPECIES: ArsI/CadI family heavy metal resistance metalloenzyme [Anabaena]AFZ60381.1 Glyoxalase/bleomycin resistance protein/dioxygenase [Anabaena cylindrica PCC 7122]MBD2416369.1 VOC family protein [Anabaena cylindrica FACHB-243]MBY5285532.1 glyoxalase/bleomycin resistance/dioxygenase family protein [Anabaena sp. CCAP 1446/1C]MBY5307926.1 glyoxalase/bleomycin resistance/dioxygenase family protein [Anabaena sp. CCAP 1446/1C]MCM2408422.1 VOC family protein [Anabaena sp. CCAP 1446/1C]